VKRATRSEREALPPLTPGKQFARAALLTVLALCISFGTHLIFVSGVQANAAQSKALDALRLELAIGTAPVGPTTESGELLELGTPVAYLEIPSLDLHEVIGEGTTSGVLFDGPGHRRDTPLPGQIGTSVVMGRRAAFGGPFSNLSSLSAGDEIVVTTGQGRFSFEVTGIRRDGDPAPARAASGTARLTLITADGTAFLPNGALRVDAQLVGDAVGGAARPFSAATLPAAERLMADDPGTLWALAFWLQALAVLAVVAVWAWHRWGRAQAWIVCLPPMLLVGLSASGEAMRLFPNLM